MLKAYFALTTSERNGLFALIMILFALLVFSKVRQLTYEPDLVDLSALQDSVQHFYESPRIVNAPSKPTAYYSQKKKPQTVSAYRTTEPSKRKPLVMVEINKASVEELIQINGVGEFYARQIIEMRKRLGGFSNVEQLMSIYSMTKEKLEGMKKQIIIDPSFCLPKVPLNSVDSFQLAEVYVIDYYVASRIVKYRERLGGFYDSEQLLEIVCIDEALYRAIMARAFLDSTELDCLDINNDDFKTIMKHPYIGSYENTKAIFRYLDYGAIANWETFCRIPYLKLNNPDRLRRYLKYNPIRAKSKLNDSVR